MKAPHRYSRHVCLCLALSTALLAAWPTGASAHEATIHRVWGDASRTVDKRVKSETLGPLPVLFQADGRFPVGSQPFVVCSARAFDRGSRPGLLSLRPGVKITVTGEVRQSLQGGVIQSLGSKSAVTDANGEASVVFPLQSHDHFFAAFEARMKRKRILAIRIRCEATTEQATHARPALATKAPGPGDPEFSAISQAFAQGITLTEDRPQDTASIRGTNIVLIGDRDPDSAANLVEVIEVVEEDKALVAGSSTVKMTVVGLDENLEPVARATGKCKTRPGRRCVWDWVGHPNLDSEAITCYQIRYEITRPRDYQSATATFESLVAFER